MYSLSMTSGRGFSCRVLKRQSSRLVTSPGPVRLSQTKKKIVLVAFKTDSRPGVRRRDGLSAQRGPNPPRYALLGPIKQRGAQECAQRPPYLVTYDRISKISRNIIDIYGGFYAV